MKTTHRARVRYLANPATRAAWRIVSVLPKGKRLGKWWTTTGEWAYCHSIKCECQPCALLPDYGIYKVIGDESHFDAWQKQEAKKKH